MVYLFEKRYRCEHIFPRGSTGEVIQAYDMADGERPVIIKRPVPLDAPPIRARQEANLLVERRALQQLAGHPALALLLRSGYSSINGDRHLYLVQEHAAGKPLSETLRAHFASGKTQPLLELLRIAHQLIDLLHHAHQRGVVYNDVDARHLFWSRPEHRLTVIDWGNAVFFEEAAPGELTINPQSDIAQVGEWLFLMCTGGRSPQRPKNADQHFTLDFGPETADLDVRLIAIISRACHPHRQHRYQKMSDLMAELDAYCQPLAAQHETMVSKLATATPETMTADHLAKLREQLAPLLGADPSDPTVIALQTRIERRAAQLDFEEKVQALLRAISAGEWLVCEEHIATLIASATEAKQTIVAQLNECVQFLRRQAKLAAPLPAPIMMACEALAAGQEQAALAAMLSSDEKGVLGATCWSLAELLLARTPAIGEYLRPPLFRLRRDLGKEARNRLAELLEDLGQALNHPQPNLEQLAAAYETAADGFGALREEHTEEGEALRGCLIRARTAAETLARLLQDIAAKGSDTPATALDSLARCQQIDPQARAWSTLEGQLKLLVEQQEEALHYSPSDEPHELAHWLRRQSGDLAQIDIFPDDSRLEARAAYAQAAALWQEIAAALTQGNHLSIQELLPQLRVVTRPHFPALTRWLETWQKLLAAEPYLQRHALHEAWGRVLADGWSAYDRGDLAAAEGNAAEALSLAREEGEISAARRLASLLSLAHDLLSDEVRHDAAYSKQLLQQLNAQFQPAEEDLLAAFERQIPQRSTYLRAMRVGLVAPLAVLSPAATRLLHLRCLLRGILALHERDSNAGEDWRQAALHCKLAPSHPTQEALVQLLAIRESLWEAATRINQLNGVHGIASLGACHDYLIAHPQKEALVVAAISLDAVRAALEAWGRADYVSAKEALTRAEENAAATEHICQLNLSPFRAWLNSLVRATQALSEAISQIRVISRRQDTSSEEMSKALRQLRDQSYQLVGETYSHTVYAWHETGQAFTQAIAGGKRRSLLLAQMEELLRGPHIAQHPALPIFQRWFERVDRAPEFFALSEDSDGESPATTAAAITHPASVPRAPTLRYPFSQPPRAQGDPQYDEAEPETADALVETLAIPQRKTRRWYLYLVLLGALVASALMFALAILVRGSGTAETVGGLAPINETLAASPPTFPSAEIDLLAWAVTSDSLRRTEDGEGWLIAATNPSAATEIALTPDELIELGGAGFRALSAEFLYQSDAASAGFGLRLRVPGIAVPAISLLAQPASGGTIKLSLSTNGQFILSEIATLAAPIARLSLRWEPGAAAVRAYFNETPIGGSLPISADVLPALFVNGDAQVRLLRWTISTA